VIGALPGKLTAPKIRLDLPATMDEAQALARDQNPNVVAAAFNEAAARDAVAVVDGELLPSANLKAGLSRAWDRQLPGDTMSSATIGAQLVIPLDNGGVAAKARQARQTAGQRRIQIEEARRAVTEGVIRAWESLSTARASIKAREAQIHAAELALEGVRQESAVGSRTVLDVLNAEQELLDARVGLARDQRDEGVASFNVSSAVGRLSAQNLKLPVQAYDYQAHYHAVRDKWWGYGIDE
jgi:outer membrane protein/adhesin transport system outer membrane protein